MASGQTSALQEFYEDRRAGYGHCENCKIGNTARTCPKCGGAKVPVRITDRLRGVVEGFDEGVQELPELVRDDVQAILNLFSTSDFGHMLPRVEVFQALGGHYGLPAGGVDAWERLLRAVVSEYNGGLTAGREARKAWAGRE